MKHKYLEEAGIKEYPDNNWGNKINPIKKIKNFSKKEKQELTIKTFMI